MRQIFGTADKALGTDTAKLSKKFVEDFDEVYLEGISHWSMMEAPEQVNKAIENFL